MNSASATQSAGSMQQPRTDINCFAETNYRNQRRRFGIKIDDRRRHMYLIGKTGMGKSNTLENMIVNDINAGNGLAVIDPHGDTVEKIIKFIPQDRINDVIFFNPSDVEYPIAFNILESVNPQYKNLVASGLVGVFKKIWADSWGPRLEYILINTILALLEYPGSTLLGVPRMLVDKKYRKKIVDVVTDPLVKAFWVNEYANYNERFRSEAISPIQNKVGQFLSSSVIRNIVGQSKSTIDLREAMDKQKILLINLSKGRIGEENSALLGAMMITRLQVAAMSRVDITEEQRKDFYLYVDEFQNFATDSFADILSEARKYRLNLIIAHQYIEQLSETVSAAVFGNVGSILVFRVGAADAEFLEKEFTPYFTETDLVNLPKYEIYLKLMIDGVASQPFSALTLSPISGEQDTKDKVIAVSRERYSKPRIEVEEKIWHWSGLEEMYRETAEEENIATGDMKRVRVHAGETGRERSNYSGARNRPEYNRFDRPERERSEARFSRRPNTMQMTQPPRTQSALSESQKENTEEQPMPVSSKRQNRLVGGSMNVREQHADRPPTSSQKEITSLTSVLKPKSPSKNRGTITVIRENPSAQNTKPPLRPIPHKPKPSQPPQKPGNDLPPSVNLLDGLPDTDLPPS